MIAGAPLMIANRKPETDGETDVLLHGLPPRVIDGFPAVESRWCGTRDVGSRHVGLPELPIGQRGLDGALELALNQAKAIPQLGDVRPSGHASRTLEDEEGREHR